MKTKLESIIYTPLEVGLEKPVRILQITDVHLSFADERDSEYNRNLAVSRVETFSKEGGRPPYTPSEYFEEAVRVAEETDSLLVLTGDVIDIQTHPSDGTKKRTSPSANGPSWRRVTKLLSRSPRGPSGVGGTAVKR